MSIYWSDYVESNCRQNYSYIASSAFLKNAYHFTALFTIPLAIFTFYVIVRVTPRKMKNMKIPLLIAHAWTTNLDLMITVNVTPVIFFPSAAGLPSAFFLMLTFYMEESDQLELRQIVLKRIPCPTIDFYDKNAIVLLKGGELLPFLSISGGLSIIVIQSLFFALHTIYHLNVVKNAHISEATKALQRKFLSYVAMQVMIPWTALVCPILYSLYADTNNYYNQALNNISMLLMACHGLMSTLCTLFIMKPYRDFVKSVIMGSEEPDTNRLWATSVVRSQASMLGSVA
ncbi:hypothetical protein GCK72_019240 [Caenorhabditis remanei]|uniref:Serpentine Receptor, class H n=1 Tax=Caenorhabditis remanei TaxID=31234 RepID=A0A6A5GDG0_CAERE|nr:hypothetical protein GCK72_019240 [Caenorhabditis remanei]KAF1752685.1 hypothetical protein GCK72_019240 [Caenorhabditis remanei]